MACPLGKLGVRLPVSRAISGRGSRSAYLSSRVPVGTVTFRVDGVQVASAAVSGGTARAVATVSKGTHVVTATFTPTDTANHVGSDSAPVTVQAK